MGERKNGLVNLLGAVARHLCNHDGHDDGHRKLEDQSAGADYDCVLDCCDRRRRNEYPLEIDFIGSSNLCSFVSLNYRSVTSIPSLIT